MKRTFRDVHPAIICVICIFGTTLFGGCTSMTPMALESKSGTLQLTSKSVGLFTLRTSNQYKPSYQPDVTSIEVAPQGTSKAVKFKVAKPHRQERDRFFEYLISVDMPSGIYRVGYVAGVSTNFLIMGSFKFFVGASLELSPNTVAYLGHIDMVNRKKKSGEYSSGGMHPLIGQAASGFADGTFDVSISDRSTTDIPLFEQTYPELKKHIIMKNIMKRHATPIERVRRQLKLRRGGCCDSVKGNRIYSFTATSSK